jgi:lauroyl/myristoyl acyltransferase
VIDASAWVGCRTPAPIAHAMATVGGHLEWSLRPRKRRQLAANLAHALPADVTGESRRRAVCRLVRREMVNEAHRSADLLWALGRPDAFLESVELPGIEHAGRVVDAGHGVILLGTHVGGWEVATAAPAATLSAPTSVVVADDWIAWAIEHARVAAGLRVVYAGRSSLELVRILRRGEIVLLLGDDPRHGAHHDRVRFLDAQADVAAGPVRLARLAQAPIVTFTVLPLGRRRWRIVVDEALLPPGRESGASGEHELRQQIADRWSETITRWPDHWAASFPITWHDDGEPAPERPEPPEPPERR